jgi:hypothetical protein
VAIGIGGLALLLVVGLGIEALAARKHGRTPMAVRRRPRFVQTLKNVTMRLRRDRNSGPPSDAPPS